MSDDAYWIFDRYEDGDVAVLVSPSGAERRAAAGELPAGAREGDALREVAGGGPVRYALDPETSDRLRAEVAALRASLRRGPSGPLSL